LSFLSFSNWLISLEALAVASKIAAAAAERAAMTVAVAEGVATIVAVAEEEGMIAAVTTVAAEAAATGAGELTSFSLHVGIAFILLALEYAGTTIATAAGTEDISFSPSCIYRRSDQLRRESERGKRCWKAAKDPPALLLLAACCCEGGRVSPGRC
jgi:hypothetical protein